MNDTFFGSRREPSETVRTLDTREEAPEAARDNTGLCRFCETPVSRGRKRSYVCGACDRQVDRAGVSVCCGLLRSNTTRGGSVAGERYCPGCPGPGKVQLVLVSPDRTREVQSWHPAPAKAYPGLSCKGKPTTAVPRFVGELYSSTLHVRDWRAWHLRQLREISPGALLPRTHVSLQCADCGSWFVSQKTTPRGRNRLRCDPCAEAARRRWKEITYSRRKHAVEQCSSCGVERKIFNKAYVLCSACERRRHNHGICSSHGQVLRRSRAGVVHCPGCTPSRVLRKEPMVWVDVTDGVTVRRIEVAADTPIGSGTQRHSAGAWIDPLVLVKDARGRVTLREAPVISGIHEAYTGLSVRAVLAHLVRRAPTTRAGVLAALVKECGADAGRSYLSNLVRAGWVDDSGVTPRAHAVLSWARAAGAPM